MKKIIFILSVATLLMTGCDKGNDFAQYNPNEIRVEASVKQTRASATSFEIGDKMGFYQQRGFDLQCICLGGCSHSLLERKALWFLCNISISRAKEHRYISLRYCHRPKLSRNRVCIVWLWGKRFDVGKGNIGFSWRWCCSTGIQAYDVTSCGKNWTRWKLWGWTA